MRIFGTIRDIFKLLFWATPWGRAYVLLSWRIYKNSELFTARAEFFGMDEAARMLSLSEFHHFLWRAEREYAYDLTVTFAPYTAIERLEREDARLKHLVKWEM